jgi:hypothetical protein
VRRGGTAARRRFGCGKAKTSVILLLSSDRTLGRLLDTSAYDHPSTAPELCECLPTKTTSTRGRVRLQDEKSETPLYSLSFPLQIRVRGRMPERTQHGDHLAFVVKRVRDHVKQNERRTTQLSKPSLRMFRQRRIELFLTESL